MATHVAVLKAYFEPHKQYRFFVIQSRGWRYHSNMSLAKNLYLMENSALKFKISSNKRAVWVHDINKKRETHREFHHLYAMLRRSPQKIFEYTRMSVNSFDLLLLKVEQKITKEMTGWRKPITPEEKLIICLR